MDEIIEVTIDLGQGRSVTLRGPSSFVREEVRHLVAQHADLASPPQARMANDERAFLQEKRPSTHAETVAVLGYWLTTKGQSEFSEDDVRRAYLRAGQRPPKSVGQALRDARSKFDLIEMGSKRGMYRVSQHGERTVLFDLPGTDA